MLQRSRSSCTFATAFAVCALATTAVHAGGSLWISESSGIRINRFNLSSNTVDLNVTPGFPGGGSNNLAYDGTTLYAGTSATDIVMHLDPATGASQSASTFYNPSAVALGSGASLYDGAYNPSSGLWRTVYGVGRLFNCDSVGNISAVYSVNGAPNIEGLEWVANTLYATDINSGRFGFITFTGPSSATFTQVPLTGLHAGHLPAALAYDQQAGTLYATAIDGNALTYLYQVDPIAGTATFLQPVGIVGGTSMGWVPVPEPATIGMALVGLFTALRRRSRQRR